MKTRALLPLITAGLLAGDALAQDTQLHWASRWQHSPGFRVRDTNLLLPGYSGGGLPDRKVMAVDLDGDHDQDLLAVGPGLAMIENLTVPRPGQEPSNAFADMSNQILLGLSDVTDGVTGDFDLDGYPDVAVVTNTSFGPGMLWLLANRPAAMGPPDVQANSAFQGSRILWDASAFYWGSSPGAGANEAIATGDFDGDGDLDLLRGSVARSYPSTPSTTGSLELLTNSENLDVPGHANSAGVVIPARRFSGTPVAGLAGADVRDIAVGDLDGDGDLDIAIAGGTTTAPVRALGFNNGGGDFTFTLLPAPISATGLPVCAAVEDLDEDGDLDVVFGHRAFTGLVPGVWSGGQVQVYESGPMGWAIGQTLGVSSHYTGIAVADIDGDARVEILASSDRLEGIGHPTVLGRTRVFSRGQGVLYADLSAQMTDDDPISTGGVAAEGSSIVVADLDLDLDLDVVVGSRALTTPSVFLNRYLQLEAPREIAVQLPGAGTASSGWPLDYTVHGEFSRVQVEANPGQLTGFASIQLSLTPPTRLFPASPQGYLTQAPWVAIPTTSVLVDGVASELPVLGAGLSAAQLSPFFGMRLFSTALHFGTGSQAVRMTSVTDTVLAP